MNRAQASCEIETANMVDQYGVKAVLAAIAIKIEAGRDAAFPTEQNALYELQRLVQSASDAA